VRTCPACGEDTRAGYSEACTNCGFSPTDPAEIGSFEVGETTIPAPGAPAETPTGSPSEPAPAPTPTTKRKRRPGIGVIVWLAIIGGSLVMQGLGLLDEPTGPPPGDVEGALVLEGATRGLSISASCPADAAETEVGARFECTVTTRSGRTAVIEVTSREDGFEYDPGDLEALIRNRK
jgi:hypothetical protein